MLPATEPRRCINPMTASPAVGHAKRSKATVCSSDWCPDIRGHHNTDLAAPLAGYRDDAQDNLAAAQGYRTHYDIATGSS